MVIPEHRILVDIPEHLEPLRGYPEDNAAVPDLPSSGSFDVLQTLREGMGPRATVATPSKQVLLQTLDP